MATSTAVIRAGILTIETPTSGTHLEIPADSDAWFAWLQTARTFAFEDPLGRFTARKKRRWRGEYWYAFRRSGGRLHEIYLGKASNVTLECLRAAAAKLNHMAEHMSPVQTASPAHAHVRPLPAERSGLSIAYHSSTSLSHSSASNLRAPRVRLSHLVRTRAVERLEQATTCPLTIVSAPAGYGKTTLIAQWTTASHLPTAWLTLDERDSDPSRFWGHVCAVLAPLVPDLLEVVRRRAPIPVSQRDNVLLGKLIAALPKAPSPTLLVLDDYHEVRTDNTAVHAGLAYLLEHLPSQVHVILASRTVPSLPLAKLRADHQLLELYVGDLQFTLAETRAFLSEGMHVDLSNEEVAVLQARTEGWVAGLQLAALSLREQPDVARWIAEFNGENRYIFDYLVEEVLNSLPTETRAFMLQISLLKRITASLCDAVTHSSDSQAILEDLERNNLFLVPLDDRREWYRFHQLFADVLLRYYRMTQPQMVPQLYGRASQWCESHGAMLEAIDYAFAANEPQQAARLIEAYIPVARTMDYRVLLLERLQRLPDSLVRQRPRLCVAHAYTLFTTGGERALMRQRVRDAEESLASTEHLFKPADLAILRAEVLALRTSIRQLLPGPMGPRELVSMHQQALAALPRHHWLRNFITLFIGIEQLVDGDVRSAARTLDALMHASEAHSDLFYVAMSSLYLGLALMRQGRLDDALARCGGASRYLAGHTDADLMARIYMVNGMVLYERNDLVPALDCLRQGISLRYDPAPFLIEAYPALAYVHLALGNRVAARQAIEQSLAEWAGTQAENMAVWPWTSRQVRAHQARLWLLQGELDAASAWARALERDREHVTEREYGPPTYVREWEDIVLARVYLAEQRAHDALQLLDQIDEAAEAEGRKSRLLEILVLQVVAHYGLGNAPAAMLTLRRAVELGAPQRVMRTFVEGSPTIQRLLLLLRAEFTQRGAHAHARTHRETTLLRYMESLIAAFATQDDDDKRRRSGHAVVARGNHATLALPEPKLTRRERQIARLLADGATNKEIAADLVISEATVKRHVSNIFLALGVRNRTRAVAQARALGLLDLEGETGVAADTGR